jgi:hypothetical protein
MTEYKVDILAITFHWYGYYLEILWLIGLLS